jgi:hypothetical protein
MSTDNDPHRTPTLLERLSIVLALISISLGALGIILTVADHL